MNLENKLTRLLRLHRQHSVASDYHYRAFCRLKKTKTFKAICARNYELEQYRHGERLARMGY